MTAYTPPDSVKSVAIAVGTDVFVALMVLGVGAAVDGVSVGVEGNSVTGGVTVGLWVAPEQAVENSMMSPRTNRKQIACFISDLLIKVGLACPDIGLDL